MSFSIAKLVAFLLIAIISLNVVTAWPLPAEHTDVAKRCGCADDEPIKPKTSTKHHKAAPKKASKPKTVAKPKTAAKPKPAAKPKVNTPAAKPKSSSSGSSSGGLAKGIGALFDGTATFYSVGQNQGACGGYYKDTDFVAALSSDLYEQGAGGDSWAAPECYASAQVEYGGKKIVVKIVDECPTCNKNSLDLSPSAFSALADQSIGELNIKWQFISKGNPKDKTPNA